MVKTKVVKVAAPAVEAEAEAAPASALKKGMPKVLKRVKSTKFFMGEGEKPKALPAKVPKKKKVVVKDAEATKRIKDKRLGVCYISHLPHGFYETQVRTFLSQYGRIKRLRLSRSKRTGASKGVFLLSLCISVFAAHISPSALRATQVTVLCSLRTRMRLRRLLRI